jgi:hypothetical protein
MMSGTGYLRKRLEYLHSKDPCCRWCGAKTTLRPRGATDNGFTEIDATIDHLNSRNNFAVRLKPNPNRERRLVLSCLKCNGERGKQDHEKLSQCTRALRAYGANVLDLLGNNLSLVEKFQVLLTESIRHRTSCRWLLRLIWSDCQHISHVVTEEMIIDTVKRHLAQNYEVVDILIPRKISTQKYKQENQFLSQFLPLHNITKSEVIDFITSRNLWNDVQQSRNRLIGKTVDFFSRQFVRVDGNAIRELLQEIAWDIKNALRNSAKTY